MDPSEYGFIVRCPFAMGWDPLTPRHLLRRQLSERPQSLVWAWAAIPGRKGPIQDILSSLYEVTVVVTAFPLFHLWSLRFRALEHGLSISLTHWYQLSTRIPYFVDAAESSLFGIFHLGFAPFERLVEEVVHGAGKLVGTLTWVSQFLKTFAHLDLHLVHFRSFERVCYSGSDPSSHLFFPVVTSPSIVAQQRGWVASVHP